GARRRAPPPASPSGARRRRRARGTARSPDRRAARQALERREGRRRAAAAWRSAADPERGAFLENAPGPGGGKRWARTDRGGEVAPCVFGRAEGGTLR